MKVKLVSAMKDGEGNTARQKYKSHLSQFS